MKSVARAVTSKAAAAALIPVLALSSAWAQAPATAPASLVVDGTFEMIAWTIEDSELKLRDLCTVVGTSVTCHMKNEIPFGEISSTITGTLDGNQIVSKARVRTAQSTAGCNITTESPLSGTIVLSPDGTFNVVWTGGGVVSVTSVTGSCAANMPRTIPGGPPSAWTGTWRQLTTGVVASGEVAFRNVLFRGLGFGGATARTCLDEVMNAAEAAAAKDAKMADDIARLRVAAAKVRAIEVLAAVPVGPETFGDFNPKWWDALKEVVPNPLAPPDPGETALDRAVDLLPPPLNVLVNIVRTGGKAMRTIKTHIADPATHAGIYACYRSQRAADQASRIYDNMGQDALEGAAAQTLLDATVNCPSQGSFRSSYEPQLEGFKGKEARNQEFKRLLRPAAVRFEFIYRVEDARQRKDAMIQERWAPVQGLLERLKSRVNACIADRASR